MKSGIFFRLLLSPFLVAIVRTAVTINRPAFKRLNLNVKSSGPNITNEISASGYHAKESNPFRTLLNKNYTCLEQDILPQSNISIPDFMGFWRAIAHTLPPNEYLFDSGITEHHHRGIIHFNGSQCIGPSLLETWLDTKNPGWVHSDYYNEKREFYSSTTYRIMFTDHEYTILYACRKILPSGKCAQNYPYVIINGRPNVTVEKETWCDLLRYVRNRFCVYLKSIHLQTQTNDCKHKLPKGLLLPANFTKFEHPTRKKVKVIRKRSLLKIQGIHRKCLEEIEAENTRFNILK